MSNDIYCPYCGAKNHKGNRFCIQCGHKLPIKDINSDYNLNDIHHKLNKIVHNELNNNVGNKSYKPNNKRSNNTKHQLNKPMLNKAYSNSVYSNHRSLIPSKLHSLKKWWKSLSRKHKWYVVIGAIVIWICLAGVVGNSGSSNSTSSSKDSTSRSSQSSSESSINKECDTLNNNLQNSDYNDTINNISVQGDHIVVDAPSDETYDALHDAWSHIYDSTGKDFEVKFESNGNDIGTGDSNSPEFTND